MKHNLTRVQKENKRKDLTASWMGRITLIKMNILPRLLYSVQLLPLYISKIAKETEKDFSKFIWQGRRLQLSAEVYPSLTLDIIIGRVMAGSSMSGFTVILNSF